MSLKPGPKPTPETDARRFWAKVIKFGPDDCWLWRGAKTDFGHGQIRIKGRCERAHRFSYSIHCGPIPPGLIVRHSCDNPPCVNPKHLLLGTKLDNSRDAIDRDRTPRGEHHYSYRNPELVARGERHSQAKLTLEAVFDIRNKLAAGKKGKDLAIEFRVSQATISVIRNNITWSR